jgi:hypothetical protein
MKQFNLVLVVEEWTQRKDMISELPKTTTFEMKCQEGKGVIGDIGHKKQVPELYK